MASTRAWRLTFAMAALVIGAAAAVAFVQEYRAVRFSRLDPVQTMLALSEPDQVLDLGWGRMTRRSLLDNCAGLQAGIAASIFPQSTRVEAANACADAARRALAASPVSGVAAYALAASSAALADWAAMNTALILSQKVSDSEGWLVDRRVALALAHFDEMDEPARAALANDVRAMAEEPTLQRPLARRYLAHADQQDWIAGALEWASETAQAGFLAAAKTEARQ